MTRELKFRAWHKVQKQMYWFDVMWGNLHGSGSGYIGMCPFGEPRKHLNFTSGNRREIDPSDCELMQFTGLFDKNGKAIYEGDIITYIQELREYKGETIEPPKDFVIGNYVVGWNESCAMWGLQLRKEWPITPVLNNMRTYNGKTENIMEVIGNIFENPELFREEGEMIK
jgi:uncharacterized phage protein (TIGR01671 family)